MKFGEAVKYLKQGKIIYRLTGELKFFHLNEEGSTILIDVKNSLIQKGLFDSDDMEANDWMSLRHRGFNSFGIMSDLTAYINMKEAIKKSID